MATADIMVVMFVKEFSMGSENLPLNDGDFFGTMAIMQEKQEKTVFEIECQPSENPLMGFPRAGRHIVSSKKVS